MLDDPALAELLRTWGLAIVAPLSVLEGPIVSMVAGYLARLGVFDLLPLLAVLILGDLVGDVALYLIGRKGRLVVRRRWLRRLRISPVQLARLVRRFRAAGRAPDPLREVHALPRLRHPHRRRRRPDAVRPLPRRLPDGHDPEKRHAARDRLDIR